MATFLQEKLFENCKYGNFSKVSELLEKDLINSKDKNLMTLLIIASSKGYYEITEMLILNGASIDQKDCMGCTALIRASSKGHHDIVKLLLDSGADPCIKDNLNRDYITVKDRYLRNIKK